MEHIREGKYLGFEIWDKKIPLKRFTRMQICSLTCATGSCLGVNTIVHGMEEPEVISIG